MKRIFYALSSNDEPAMVASNVYNLVFVSFFKVSFTVLMLNDGV